MSKYTFKIEQDEDAMDPRKEMDNAGVLVLTHRRYNLPCEADITFPERPVTLAVLKRYMQRYYDAAIVLPVYGYDHSGLSIQAGSRSYPFNDRWDSGDLGIIYITRETVRKEWGALDERSLKQAQRCLMSEIETYNQYLQGDVWGYVIEDETGEIIDSCWGFYGSETAEQEAKRGIEYLIQRDTQLDQMIYSSYAL